MPMLCRAFCSNVPPRGWNLKSLQGVSRYPSKGCGSSDDGLRSKVRTAKREGSRCGEREPSFFMRWRKLEELYRACWRSEGDAHRRVASSSLGERRPTVCGLIWPELRGSADHGGSARWDIAGPAYGPRKLTRGRLERARSAARLASAGFRSPPATCGSNPRLRGQTRCQG
jgi:hypothetical protein